RLGFAQAKDFLALYLADEWFFGEKFEEKGINTADRALVEFSAARRVESDNVVALINRRRLFETHEDVVYRMTQPPIDKRQLIELKRDLSGAAQAMWQLFDAQTTLLLAAANRELPEATRKNDPSELEAHAFQTVGSVMRDRPDHAAAAEVMVSLLTG